MKKIYLFLFLSSILPVSAQNNTNFTLAPNGVTCLCPNAAIGESGLLTINGIDKTFTKRTRAQLDALIASDQADPQIALTCTSGINDMSFMFDFKTSFNQDISSWDVSDVSSMSFMFSAAFNFNQDISDWDVSNVTEMWGMFETALNFNQDISAWDVANVNNMEAMFEAAGDFNQPLNNWDVSSVTNMRSMFRVNASFNQALNNWDTSNVTNMTNMFDGASVFNQDISGWCVENIVSEPTDFATSSPLNTNTAFKPNWGATCTVSNPDFTLAANGITCLCPNAAIGDSGVLNINGVDKTFTKRTKSQLENLISADSSDPQIALTCTSGITDMSFLFLNSSFNQDISSWDVSGVTNMSSMFRNADSFNQPLNNWDVSQVSSMSFMFSAAASFNQDVSSWDVSGVTNMNSLFRDADAFNQPLNNWDVSSVNDMEFMFNGAIAFNESLDNWDVSSVINMRNMFRDADSFNQSLNNWDVSSVTDMGFMFSFTENFNQPLNNWDTSSAINMDNMFRNASIFNQDLSNWCVEQIVSEPSNFALFSTLDSNPTNHPNWGAACNGCEKPLNLNVSNITTDSADLSWDAEVTAIAGYDYVLFTDNTIPDENSTPTGSVTSGVTSVSLTGLATATGYKVYVRSNCGSNLFSSWSDVLDFSTDSNCLVPSNLNINNITTNSADLSWSSESTATGGYDYVLFTDNTMPDENTIPTGSTTSGVTSVSFAGLATSTAYKVYVRSNCGSNVFSLWSDVLDFSTNGIANPDFTLAPNGVTCLCPNAAIGESGLLTINGVDKTFTKRTRAQLDALIASDQADPQIALTCTSGINDMSFMFDFKTSFNQDISSWDVSDVSSMSSMFSAAFNFNQDISVWNVSNVNSMDNMFEAAFDFDQPLSDWNVSNVTSMASMFESTSSFNQPIGNWDVSNVTNFDSMFAGSSAFDQPLNNWIVSAATNMRAMFETADNFNQPLNSWNTSNVSNMAYMFNSAFNFNQDISGWCVENIVSEPTDFATSSPLNTNTAFKPNWGATCTVSNPDFTLAANGITCLCPNAAIGDSGVLNINGVDKTFTKRTKSQLENLISADSSDPQIALSCTSGITDMSFLFLNSSFNQDISSWDVSGVTNMSIMFRGANAFNQPINNWDVSQVSSMSLMFSNAASFNQNISSWDVSSVTDMNNMFRDADAFNQPLNNWDVSSVNDMESMFNGTIAFNEPLDNWDVSSTTNMKNMFRDADSFNQSLNNWDTSSVNDMEFMFNGAIAFNEPLDNWDVSSVTNMRNMFRGANAFNQPLNNWDVSGVNDMGFMFFLAENFNQPLNNWDTSSAINMDNMFRNASIFNQDLSSWCVEQIVSEPSNFAAFSTLDSNPTNHPNWGAACNGCEKPLNLNVTNITTNSVEVSWDTEVTAIAGYDYVLFTDNTIPDENSTPTGSVTSGVTSVSLTGLATATDYKIYIRSNCGSNLFSSWSDVLDFSTNSNCPALSNLNINNITTNSADLSWSSESTATGGYDYVLFTDNTMPDENTSPTGSTASGVTSVSLTGLAGTTAYKVYVRSNCGNNGFSLWSDVLDFSTNGITNPDFNLALNGVTCLCPSAAVGDSGTLLINGVQKTFTKRTRGQLDVLIASNPNDPQIALTCTSGITDMSSLFSETTFNQDISSWDVSQVNSMSFMFSGAESFNQDISSWDVSGVSNVEYMFEFAFEFNQPLSDWNVSNLTSMRSMFEGANNFNQPIGNWDVSNVTDFDTMFSGTSAFNQNLNNWDVSAATNMKSMFEYADSFNQPLEDWNTSNVSNMHYMFNGAFFFNQDISSWCVENIVSEPFNFADNTPLQSNPAFNPNWGASCNGCEKPINFNVTNITTNSAVVSWDTEVTATGGYDYVLFTDASIPDENTSPTGSVGAAQSSVNLTGIFSETNFTFYLRSNCGNNNFSDWSAGVSFGTQPVVETALDFDGLDDIIVSDAPSPSILPKNNESRSVEFSINTVQSSTGVVVSWGKRDSGMPDSQGKMSAFGIKNGKVAFLGELLEVIGTIDVNDGQWHDVTITYDGTNVNSLKIYVDGILDTGTYTVFSQSGSLTLETDTTIVDHKLIIGATPKPSAPNFFLNGTIDDVRIWNITLTESEVSSYAGIDIPSNTNGLVAYFNFQDGTSVAGTSSFMPNSFNTLEDLTGNYDGTLENFSQSGNSSNWVLRAINYWNGSENQAWNNPNNWRLLTIPSVTDHVIIQDVPIKPLVAIDESIELSTLEIIENAELGINGVLKITRSILNNGTLTFKSNSTATGQFDLFNGIISGNGNEKTERYIPAGDNNKRAFRFLTTSVNSSGSINANWQEGVNNTGTNFPTDNQNPNSGFGTHITGGLASDGFDQNETGTASMFTFDNSNQNVTVTQDDDWYTLPNTNSKTLKAGEAYLTFIRGDRSIDVTSNSATPTNTTLRASGDLHVGPREFSSANNATTPEYGLSDQADFYSLVGNPYQAIVDINNLDFTNVKSNFYWVWDPNLGSQGQYTTVSLPSGLNNTTSSANQFVQPGQSFFVQTIADGASSLTYNEDDKNTSGGATIIFSDQNKPSIQLLLYTTNAFNTGAKESDGALINFSENANNGLDLFDADKFLGPGENLARLHSNELISIENRAMPTDNEILALSTTGYTEDNYTFVVNASNIQSNFEAYLLDNYTGGQTLLNEGATQINFSVDANIPESIAADRFNLVFDNTTLGINENSFGADFSLYPNPTKDGYFSIRTPNLSGEVTINLNNMLGQIIMNENLTIVGNEVNIKAKGLSTGVYIVKLTQDEQTFSTKLIVE